MGHFLAGRWCGVDVKAFSIGFGPELFGFYDKRGTRWKFSAIPLGGYVKFAGDLNVASSPDFDAANQMTEEEKRVSFPTRPSVSAPSSWLRDRLRTSCSRSLSSLGFQ